MHDVVIVGAGPAGSTAAKLLAEAGRDVCLIDMQKFPRPKACAAWVSVKAFAMFDYLDDVAEKAIETPFAGLVFHSPDLSLSGAFTERGPSGYLTTRAKFDHALLRLARAAGAKVMQGCQAVSVHANEDSVVARMADGTAVEGGILVGADGVNSLVGRKLGLHAAFPHDRAIRCLCQEVSSTARKIEAFYGKQRPVHVVLSYRGSSGYGWVFPKKSSVNVGLGVRQGGGASVEDLFPRFVADLKRAGVLPEELNADAPEAWLNPAGAALDFEGHVGKRTLLIGDAGGFVAAGSGEGIFPAMWSARIAADVIDRSLKMDRLMDGLLAFKHEWRPLMADYLRIPNSNLAFLLPLIFSNQQMTDKFARAYLYGENI